MNGGGGGYERYSAGRVENEAAGALYRGEANLMQKLERSTFMVLALVLSAIACDVEDDVADDDAKLLDDEDEESIEEVEGPDALVIEEEPAELQNYFCATTVGGTMTNYVLTPESWGFSYAGKDNVLCPYTDVETLVPVFLCPEQPDGSSARYVGSNSISYVYPENSPCPNTSPPANSCQGRCGGQAPAGCWCDYACSQYGDCCGDKVAQCG